MKIIKGSFLFWLLVHTLPHIYRLYMGFVYLTSRKTYISAEILRVFMHEKRTIMGAICHQDVLTAPFVYRGKNVTLISSSKDGDLIAGMAERCGFKAIRGSSTRGGTEALAGLIDYLLKNPGCICGITVDGPKGPALVPKKGILVIAKETGGPVFPARTWAKYRLLFKNWDHTMLPLPFNHLVFLYGEPFFVPKDCSEDELEAYRVHLQNALLDLVKRSKTFFRIDRKIAEEKRGKNNAE